MQDPKALLLAAGAAGRSIPVTVIAAPEWPQFKAGLDRRAAAWAAAQGFAAEPGRELAIPSADGSVSRVLAGATPEQPFALGRLARVLPAGIYRLEGAVGDARLAALAWCLEAYSFDAYRKRKPAAARLVCPAGVDRAEVLRSAAAIYLVRDLVNTPASDMGPDELEAAARAVARSHTRPSSAW